MKKLVTLALTGIFAAALAGAALAANEPFDIVKGTAKLDGKLDDFIAAKAQGIKIAAPEWVNDVPDATDANDLSGTAYFMYDAKAVYFGIDVTDDVLEFNKYGRDIWNQDAIELWLDGKQFGFSASADDKKTAVTADWMGTDAAVDAVYVQTPKGYTIEASIPVADLAAADVEIKQGAKLQVSFGIDDADEEDGNRIGMIVFPKGMAWGNPETFATGTFK
jgi:hypothetical protein